MRHPTHPKQIFYDHSWRAHLASPMLLLFIVFWNIVICHALFSQLFVLPTWDRFYLQLFCGQPSTILSKWPTFLKLKTTLLWKFLELQHATFQSVFRTCLSTTGNCGATAFTSGSGKHSWNFCIIAAVYNSRCWQRLRYLAPAAGCIYTGNSDSSAY